MALLNLSLVTETLTRLIRGYFVESPGWSGTAPTVSPRPPDKVDSDAVGIYLYHISEDPHYRNLPAPGSDAFPVRYVPMALNLYYQLTAHSTSDDTLLEQQMMGIAVKALHDYPVIDDSMTIDGDAIFAPGLQGSDDRLRIVLQPVAHNEAVNYWTAGSSALRLSAYYQVSVVLLEPEESDVRAGRVLAYGVHTFLGGAPRLDTCRNTLLFTIPGESTAREIMLQPAQAPVGDQVTFTGSGLTGHSTSLLLRNSNWDEPVEADTAWSVVVTSDSVSAVVQEAASGTDVLPGIYSAMVRVVRQSTLSSGEIREFEHVSNECPFAITPRIDEISAPDVDNVVTVRGYIFSHTDLSSDDVKVYLGGDRLTSGTAGALNPGEFAVIDPPPLPDVLPILQLRLPAGLTPGQFLPLRIFVNGAESPPNWVEIP